jgi:hypothetical protein
MALRFSERTMPTKNDVMARFLLPAIAGLSSALLALSAVRAIAVMTSMTPHVGDIVSFVPSANQRVEDGVRLIVHRPDQFGCVLDLGILRHSGGSLIVESEVNKAVGSFQVHWAGERTTADTGNCGSSADLILDRLELDILALGAGGYGAERRLLPVAIENGI